MGNGGGWTEYRIPYSFYEHTPRVCSSEQIKMVRARAEKLASKKSEKGKICGKWTNLKFSNIFRLRRLLAPRRHYFMYYEIKYLENFY